MWLSEIFEFRIACSAIFRAANNLALNCCSDNSNPFLPTNTCFTVGSFSAAICPKLETSTGTSRQPIIFKFWSRISVSKVVVTTDLSVATVHLSIFPQEKAAETLAAIKTNTALIKHDLSQRVKLQLRKVPNLTFYIDDSLDYIEKIDNALNRKENPIEDRSLLEKRKKI